MERVKVVKAIPGILEVGDILVSPQAEEDFCLEETKITEQGSSERYISMDYVTVSENIPQFFQFELFEDDFYKEEVEEEFEIVRTKEDIFKRKEFFEDQFNKSVIGSEQQVVYKNLMWFIDWLTGEKELI